jgi:uncharacterized lipoprotein YmbA
MNVRRGPSHRPPFATALLLLAGCVASRPSSFFVLAPLAVEGDPPARAAAPRVHVDVVELAEYLARAELVTRVGRTGLELAPFERWGEPLRDAVARVVSADLAVLLGGAVVTRYPWERPLAPDAVLLSLAIERFEAQRDAPGAPAHVVLVARWRFGGALAGERGGSWTLPVAGDGVEAVVHTMSSALGYLAREIAGALPTPTGAPPALSSLVPLADASPPPRAARGNPGADRAL